MPTNLRPIFEGEDFPRGCCLLMLGLTGLTIMMGGVGSFVAIGGGGIADLGAKPRFRMEALFSFISAFVQANDYPGGDPSLNVRATRCLWALDEWRNGDGPSNTNLDRRTELTS